MVASIKPQRDEVGLGDGRMLIGGAWCRQGPARPGSTLHPATGEQVASFPVAGAATWIWRCWPRAGPSTRDMAADPGW